MRSAVGDGGSGASGAGEEDLYRSDVDSEPIHVPEDGSEPDADSADGSESVRVRKQEATQHIDPEDDAKRKWQQ
jgi:hypothetical protein